MRFGVVVSDPEDWTARAILTSFIRRRVDAVFLNFSLLAASIERDISFYSNGINILELDGLVVRDLGRRGAHDVAFRFETLQALEKTGLWLRQVLQRFTEQHRRKMWMRNKDFLLF